MLKENRLQNIGVVLPEVDNILSLFLADLLKILLPISKNLYVIAGNADPKDYGAAYVYSIRYRSGSNLLTRITNHVHLQLKILYRLAKLARSVDLWLFFMGGASLLLPILAARLAGKKVVLVFGGHLEKEGEVIEDVLYRPLVYLRRLNLALSSGIILYSSRLIREWHLEKHRHKIYIADRHFIDLSNFHVKKPLNDRGNLIGYIGRLSVEKGTMNFIEAIIEILKDKGELRFLIGGDGQLRDRIERYVNEKKLQDKVRLTGWIPHNEIADCLNELKLLVLPSYTEGLSNIVLEAMACGTPVVVTAVGAIPDIIKDEKTGFIMEDNYPRSIAINVIRALDSPYLEEITRDAYAIVEKDYNYEAAVKRYKYLLDSMK